MDRLDMNDFLAVNNGQICDNSLSVCLFIQHHDVFHFIDFIASGLAEASNELEGMEKKKVFWM